MDKRRVWNRGRVVAVAFMVLVVAAAAVLSLSPVGRHAGWAWRRLTGGATVEQRLAQYGPAARARLQPYFDKAGVVYPPAAVMLLGIKDGRELEVWARHGQGGYRHVRTYPILAASGVSGPKLREGDRQVPEGLYRIESLHPNSRYHLALRVNYPNEDDRRRAAAEGRSDLGGDIMIHGSNVSVGCLAMGDEAAEDLFVLVADAGVERTELLLMPTDFRLVTVPAMPADAPAWTGELYASVRARLDAFGATNGEMPAEAGMPLEEGAGPQAAESGGAGR